MPLMEYWYNTIFHTALGRTPFEVLYDHPPRQLGIDVESLALVPDLQSCMADRVVMTDLIQ